MPRGKSLIAQMYEAHRKAKLQQQKLEAQAKVATEYRDLEAKLRQTQQLLWFSKQQDATRSRERQTAEVGNLTVAFEALRHPQRARPDFDIVGVVKRTLDRARDHLPLGVVDGGMINDAVA